MSEVRLTAEVRTEFGKGGARRTRRSGKIPAVIYGHGADPRHVSLPAREFAQAIRHGGGNVLLTLTLDGKDELTIPKSVQRHPIRGDFEHVDLIAVRRGERVTIDVPLHVSGEVAPGAMLGQEHTTVQVEAEATHLPSDIQVSVEGLEVGSHITAGDLTLPSGATLVTDAETLLLNVIAAPTAEDIEADTASSIAELGIVEEPHTDETESDAGESGEQDAPADES
ncbi:50S ribosomal protein L25/general stress protein Ctc [Jatrophihabitans sp.]|uniref:50S ribosomal protein L25/general stress protein Ctc n=1 Tax=Jatrophihabitans sp. TaxID=1932789 RepID=UPI002CCED5C9|nr:50S ribosomal protein L25/general stress protein Ctc [Jatrophihabitans sp.]